MEDTTDCQFLYQQDYITLNPKRTTYTPKFTWPSRLQDIALLGLEMSLLSCLMAKMGGCQNYGPFWGTLNNRCRSIIGTQKGTIILTNAQMAILLITLSLSRYLNAKVGCLGLVCLDISKTSSI